MVRVSGWSGPSTRSWSASSSVERGDGPGRVPGLAPPVGEVVAGGQGVGVVGAQDPQLVGEQLRRTRSTAPAGSPACPRQRARLLRVVRVSGWSGPRTRSRSASSSVERGDGPGRVPGLAPPVGEVVAGGQGVGVVGTEPGQAVVWSCWK